ncbi:FadR/GntR family transcriptional regulator [Pinisolibacter aquiterrae]|jgi:DNA-binding FadR family transcriptional regulator|uniref:FadR/GntR family transcriptional regulator n=1 Tax=Pinisolibacter aquiterrae TaxID=2815579 RepID=UPI001C3D2B0D|nr:FCD domain-containing protein [Pinisolibacter aquiterrae]MBV5265825.1 FadR family transcriptional regulator [Pinisolibacter aquiterrae]MCC8236610.1 FCD domain-containing protein [Pinisolibacter aquiterrae]
MSREDPILVGGRDLGAQVAERLAADLFSGRVKPGDFLPKEVELTETFGVSRASIRAGLQILVALGIVRRFAGQGTVVAEYCDWNMLDPQVTRWLVDHADPNIDFLTEILEFRYAAEPYISAIAAERASARDLMAMEEAHKAMAAAVDPLDGQVADQDVFDDADVAFHAAIYRATHNIVWAQLSHILSPAIRLVIRRTNATADELRDTLERHRLLMECIRLRRPREAFDAAIHVMNRTAVDLGSSGRQTHRDLIDLMRRQVEADLRSAP